MSPCSFVSRWDPLERMTPDQALQHDWIQDAKLYYQNKSKDSQHHRQSNSNHQRRGGGGKEKKCENASSKKLKERRPSADNKTHNSSTTAEGNFTPPLNHPLILSPFLLFLSSFMPCTLPITVSFLGLLDHFLIY